jgi:hypothetical protein
MSILHQSKGAFAKRKTETIICGLRPVFTQKQTRVLGPDENPDWTRIQNISHDFQKRHFFGRIYGDQKSLRPK